VLRDNLREPAGRANLAAPVLALQPLVRGYWILIVQDSMQFLSLLSNASKNYVERRFPELRARSIRAGSLSPTSRRCDEEMLK